MVVGTCFAIYQHRAQKNKVAEFRMDEIAVNSHVSESSLDGDGFMRHQPHGARSGLIHLHGKSHGRVHGADASRLQLRDNCGGDVIDLIAGAVEFEVGYRAWRSAHWLARHSHDEAQ